MNIQEKVSKMAAASRVNEERKLKAMKAEKRVEYEKTE